MGTLCQAEKGKHACATAIPNADGKCKLAARLHQRKVDPKEAYLMVGKTTKEIKFWVGCTKNTCKEYLCVLEEIKAAIEEGSVLTKADAKQMKELILERLIPGRKSKCSGPAVILDLN